MTIINSMQNGYYGKSSGARGSVIDLGGGGVDHGLRLGVAWIESQDTIPGTNDADTLFGTSAGDLLLGKGGNDVLLGGGGADTLNGGDGRDTAGYLQSFVGLNLDLLKPKKNTGEGIGDKYISIENLLGTGFDDTVRGDDNNNILIGANGSDLLFGREGDDTLVGGQGKDRLYGDDGSDWANYNDAQAGLTADLGAPGNNTAEAKKDVYISIENLEGSFFDDVLRGDGLNNFIEGDLGKDDLFGQGGVDTLSGGGGKDTLTGGASLDFFALSSTAAGDAETITDLVAGVDKVALVGAVYGLAPGFLPSSAFVLGTSAQDASDRLIFDAGTDRLFFDPDGTGSAAQVLIASFINGATLSSTDFVVV